MRKTSIILAAVMLVGPSAAAARLPGPIIACPQSGGTTHPPFYGVRATQSVMQARPIRVTGQYPLNMRNNRLVLLEVRPQGIDPATLLLRLKMVPDPTAGGRCFRFFGQFPPRKFYRVQITDWRKHSIVVPIRRGR